MITTLKNKCNQADFTHISHPDFCFLARKEIDTDTGNDRIVGF
jgi:hypothetical protein